MNSTYRISEVAKRFCISRTALIHYDNIDLLKPSYRNEKDYRFYTHQDLMKLELILALKESGLSIKAIKQYINGQSTRTNLEILQDQTKELDKKISELMRTKETLNQRISFLERFKELEYYEGIRMEYYDELKIQTEDIGYGPLMSLESAKIRLSNKLPNENHLASKFGICFTFDAKQARLTKMNYVFDYLIADEDQYESTQAPASYFIRSLHHGTIHSVDDTLKKMMTYCLNQNLTPKAQAYFVPLFDYWEVTFQDEVISEILIPVSKNEAV